MEAEGVLAEQKAELLEESGVQRKGLVEQGRSVQGSRSSTRAWIGTLHLPTADGDQREFDLETRVTTNGNIIISEMLHSCALNK